ncbi:MAG: NAD(P)-dependent oxidoreductase, partial [Hydrocarboniphaga effusa]|nr:NAD(P)-dependent oxidoreductase [Hydrocarboniphaga effusa]
MAKNLLQFLEVSRQDPKKTAVEVRLHDFREIYGQFGKEQAAIQAARCLSCGNPYCEWKCPVHNYIPNWLKLVKEGNLFEAAELSHKTNSLPEICGRVCPQETQCEAECHMVKRFNPVAIGHLERYVADWERTQPLAVEARITRKEKIAVIGAGPAGLVCAGELARLGYAVTIYEALHAPGGVLRYGIPEFRLPKAILDWEIGVLKAMGVEIVCNVIVGKLLTLADLFERFGYAAVFIGTGAGLPQFLGIPGENLNGVMSANEFLTRINLMRAYEFPDADTPLRVGKRVAVIGAGNTAMDAVRCALRMGAEEGMIVYRRSEKEMGARVEEYHHALEEGVQFRWLTNPLEILGDS